MIQLHATRKLFARLKLDVDGILPATPRSQWLFDRPSLDINPLSGWHGNLVTLQRRNCVLLVHDRTRFPLVLPALLKSDFAELNDRFIDVFMNTLLKCGAGETHMKAAECHLAPLMLDTHCNRSVQGTLNRMAGDVEQKLWFDKTNVADMTGYQLSAWLADTPRTAKGTGFLWPQREMLDLLAGLAEITGAGQSQTPAVTSETLPDNVISLQAFRQRKN